MTTDKTPAANIFYDKKQVKLKKLSSKFVQIDKV